MTLYTPPPDKNNRGVDSNGSTKLKRFYQRPSIGLKMWGPLVPASDNRIGLWSLVGAQTFIGLLFLRRGSMLRAKRAVTGFVNNNAKPISKKDIAEIPSLNVFSSASVSAPASTSIPAPAASGTLNYFTQQINNGYNYYSGNNYQKEYWPRLRKFNSYLYSFVGIVLLAQSVLETLRLTLLKYDPWYDEAKSAREKKFFNDIVRFYHEGIDPTKIKVKDASSGNTLPTNIPQVRQSVALVRAQGENDSTTIKWFGPIEFKPMSFNNFLDKLEYNLDMQEKIEAKKKSKQISQSIQKNITHIPDELEKLVALNQENRLKALELPNSNPDIIQETNPHQASFSQNEKHYPPRAIIMDTDHRSPEEIDLNDIWFLYNPWMNLALDTSLSIKFLPTVVTDLDPSPDSILEEQSSQLKPTDDTNPNLSETNNNNNTHPSIPDDKESTNQ